MADPPKEQFKHDEDFVSLYANNVRFEPSVWDLKILFGTLDQSTPGEITVEQHTAMTLAWPELKLMAYFLLVYVVGHQAENGNIALPSRVLPPRPDSSDPTITDTAGKKAVEYIAWIHDQFFGPSHYVPPAVEQLDTPSEEKP